MTNLSEAFYAAVATVHGQAMADAVRANPSTGYGAEAIEPRDTDDDNPWQSEADARDMVYGI